MMVTRIIDQAMMINIRIRKRMNDIMRTRAKAVCSTDDDDDEEEEEDCNDHY